jgi:hypothetical protein
MKKFLIATLFLVALAAPAYARIGNEIPLGWVHTEHLACSPSSPPLPAYCTLRPPHGVAENVRDVPNGQTHSST